MFHLVNRVEVYYWTNSLVLLWGQDWSGRDAELGNMGVRQTGFKSKVHIVKQTVEGFCRKAAMILGNSRAEQEGFWTLR